jgi:hypothetical protein
MIHALVVAVKSIRSVVGLNIEVLAKFQNPWELGSTQKFLLRKNFCVDWELGIGIAPKVFLEKL